MPTYAGRVEALCTVPSGTTVSAATGALSSAVTVTLPSGQYYPTAAGSISGWTTELAAQLNANVRQYPESASALQAAIGYGNWASGAGWLMQEASGSLAAAFGSPSLTAVSSPTYRNAGPADGKYAIGFDSNADAFSAGDTFDVNATSDMAWAWVANFGTDVLANFLSKGIAGVGEGRLVIYTSGSGGIVFEAYRTSDGANLASASITGASALFANVWHVGIATIDRGTGKMRIGIRTLSGTSYLSSEATIAASDTSSSGSFLVGVQNVATAPNFKMAALYVTTGSSVATGLSANLSTALTNFAAAINSSWSVSLSSSTGRVTLSHSFWPCYVDFSSTNLQALLGFEYDFDYPQTAAQMSAAVGWGTWSAGYLLNESASPCAVTFGATANLTATSSPTFAGVGVRGGADKAVGFDSSADALNGGDVYDVSATEDLCVAFAGYLGGLPSGSSNWFSKGATPGYYVFRRANGSICWVINDAVSVETGSGQCPTNEPIVGMCVVERGTNRARLGVIGLRTGTSYITTELNISAQGTLASSSSFCLGAGVVAAVDTAISFSAFYIGVGPSAATGLSANLSTALSNFATYLKSQTGTTSARGVWLPDCPINLDGDPDQAPSVTDRRDTESPTGVVLSLVGNRKYRHRNVRWPAVPRAATWESAVTVAKSSYEQWLIDTQFGLGHSWFRPGARVQVYWDRAGSLVTLGNAQNLDGWFVKGITSTEPTMTSPPYTGLWNITWPELVSDG
jgi:hypothetical protein